MHFPKCTEQLLRLQTTTRASSSATTWLAPKRLSFSFFSLASSFVPLVDVVPYTDDYHDHDERPEEVNHQRRDNDEGCNDQDVEYSERSCQRLILDSSTSKGFRGRLAIIGSEAYSARS